MHVQGLQLLTAIIACYYAIQGAFQYQACHIARWDIGKFGELPSINETCLLLASHGLLRRNANSVASTPQLLQSPEHVSTINKLPIEILEQIFIHCLPGPLIFVIPTPFDAPLLLCTVCRLWRSMAISMPELWCSMKITEKFSIKFVGTWLSRAKACPLSIAFTLDSRAPHASLPFHSKRLHKHFDLLLPLSHLWQSLEIRVLPGAPLSHLDKLLDNTLPNLERLVLRFPHGTRMYNEKRSLEHVFRSCSRLRQVFVFGDDSIFSMTMFLWLPSPHLEIVCTDSLWYPAECVGFLSRMLDLKQGFFRLGHLTPLVPVSLPPSPVLLKDMRTLSLQTFTSLTDLFTHLTLPALIFLRINFGRIDSWSHSAFISFVSSFSSNLTTLHLDGPPILEATLIEYLRLLPSLDELGLTDRSRIGTIGNELLSSLTYRGEDSEAIAYLCPKLTVLELFGVHACADEHLVEMLESRWRRQDFAHHDDLVSLNYSSSSSPRPLNVYNNTYITRRHSHKPYLYVSRVSGSVSDARRPCSYQSG